MSNKLFSPTGRLHTFTGDKPHEWVLKDEKGQEYFRGTANELAANIAANLLNATYSSSGRKGRRKK